MLIKGGLNSKVADVSDGNRLKTYSVTESEEWFANEHNGKAFSLVVTQTPTAGGDCFVYIKNNSSNILVITSLKAYMGTDETIQVKLGDTGTAATGTTATPVNRNAGSGNVIDGTVETGNDITGLSGGVVVDQFFFNADESTQKHTWQSGIMIPKNKVLTLYAVTGGIAINCTLSLHYHGSI